MSEPGHVIQDNFGSSKELIEELKGYFGDRVTTSAAVRERHGTDESFHAPCSPDAVVFARSTEDVQYVVNMCSAHRVPVIAYGTGTSLEGHVAALYGGICIDLAQMNEVLSVNPEDLDCIVQAGVTRKQLNEHLRDTGLFFAVDPGADASIGGMASTRASGTNAVRYGTMRETVMSLKVVLADGRVIQTARRSRKSAAGYDLTRLFVGSEGTLGIITEITLRLHGIPEAISAAVCSFPSIDDAVTSVIATVQSGIPVARIELLNADQMEISIKYSNLENMEVKPTLFFEFHGSETSNKESIELVKEISNSNNGSTFKWAKTTEERNKIWKARHDVYYSVKSLRPNSRVYTTDVCVPISRLAECMMFAEKEIKNYGLKAPIIGHVGDGNFHHTILYNPNNKHDYKMIREFSNKLIQKALELEGTITGEHGVGINKKEYLLKQHHDNIPLMSMIKKSIDPNNIMNPGKIFDLE